MARFIIRRLLQMVGVVVRAVPAPVLLAARPARAASSPRCSASAPPRRPAAALTEALGLDQPVYVQYLKFLQRAVAGRVRRLHRRCCPGSDAFHIFLARLPATIELSICAMAIAIVFAIPLGYLAAKRHGSTFDNGAIVLSLIGVAVPVFFLAFLLKYWFAVEHPIFPVSGRQDSALGCTRVTGFFVARRAADPRVRLLGRRPAPPGAARRSRWPPSRSR